MCQNTMLVSVLLSQEMDDFATHQSAPRHGCCWHSHALSVRQPGRAACM